MKKTSYFLLLAVLISGSATAQHFDLPKMAREGELISGKNRVVPQPDMPKPAVVVQGIAWLKGTSFSEGTIDVDLQGADGFQKSFIGIAFHGADTTTYDCVYFRSFNFRADDPVRKIHAVQYVSEPLYSWKKLRDEHNGVYEKGISPPPAATDWFHAKIVVRGMDINVYVNNETRPCLTVKKLNDRHTGLIGLWSVGEINGNFANLVIGK